MARKGENIRKRADGRWEARFIVGYRATGKAIYKSVYAKTYSEVRSKRNSMISAERPEQTYTVNRKCTVEQLMKDWLDYVHRDVKESTYAKYVYLVKNHICPVLGTYCLAGLCSRHIERFVDEKLNHGKLRGEGGLSPKTVADILSLLSQAVHFGIEHNYPCPSNLKIHYPRQEHVQIQILSISQQFRLERMIFQNPEPVNLGILISLYTGLRIGEVCALRWEDFRMEEGTVKIERTLMRIQDIEAEEGAKTKILIDTPKTRNSNRIIPLPSVLIDYLQSERDSGNGYLLTGTEKYMEPRTYFQKYKLVMESCGLGEFNYHALRHTFATRCVEKGFDIKSLSEILGHADVTTTMRRYVHPSLDMKREQMERLSEETVWGQKKGSSSCKDTEMAEKKQKIS